MKINHKESYLSPTVEELGTEAFNEILQSSYTGEGIGEENDFTGFNSWN